MAYPTKYTRQYDFASYQNSNPSRPLPADKVNADLNAAQNSVGEIVDFLKNISRADGKLANKSVGRDQLADNVPLGFDTPTAWAARTLYTETSTVFHNNIFYKANVEHTSGDSFDATKWDVIADFSGAVAAAQASADAAAASASAASGSVTDAETAETNAEAAQTAAEAAQALAEAAAASIALVVTPQQYGAVAGESENGVTNAAAFQSAIDAVAAAGGGVVWVRNVGEPYVIGDTTTTNTCIRLKSNVTLLHDPGVVYHHQALGRTSPASTNVQGAHLASQACLFQLDGVEDGALENVRILGQPKIDGLGTTPIRRGVNMFGEINNCVIEVWGHDLRDMLLTWPDEDDFRFSKGENLSFSLKYTGPNTAAGTSYELVNLFPKSDRSGRPGVRHIRFYDCDMDGTNGTTADDITHAVTCIKLNNCEDVEFGPKVKLRGGAIACLTISNGTLKVRGSLDVGDSLMGVFVTDASNVIALDSPTGYVDLDVQMSGAIGTDRLNAAVVQGACPGINLRIQSQNGGLEFRESDFPVFDVSGVALSSSTVTVSIASPGVVTWPGHGRSAGDPVRFTTDGALPTGLIATQTYWVKTVLDANTFTVAATSGGTAVNTSGSQSGTHTGSTCIAKGVTLTASGGASGTVQGLNASGSKIVLSRAGLDAIAAGETFTTPGVSGTIATVYEPDGLVGGRFTGYCRRGWLHMEAAPAVRNPIRECFIDLAIDGASHATASQSDTGSANWYMQDSDITLRFVNPPNSPLSNYGRNNKITISSDGVGTNVPGGIMYREFGKGTVLNAHVGKNNTKHDYIYSLETGGSQLTLQRLSGPSTIKRKQVSTGQEVTIGNRMVRADFLLSGSGTTQVLQMLPYPAWVTGVQVVYPDGTTADAGVTVELGVLTDSDAVLTFTSPTSQSAGVVVAYTQTGNTGLLLKESPLTGGTLAAHCAGGKTGADRAVMLVHVVDLMPVS